VRPIVSNRPDDLWVRLQELSALQQEANAPLLALLALRRREIQPSRDPRLERVKRRIEQERFLQWMHAHVGELVEPVDVVVVAVGRDRGHFLLGEIGEPGQTRAEVDQREAVATTQMPNVAAHEWHDARLAQQRDVVVDALALAPSCSKGHHVRHAASLEGDPRLDLHRFDDHRSVGKHLGCVRQSCSATLRRGGHDGWH
jgi:hypothetical protein